MAFAVPIFSEGFVRAFSKAFISMFATFDDLTMRCTYFVRARISYDGDLVMVFSKVINVAHSTIYSATTFLEKCRKVVLEKWF